MIFKPCNRYLLVNKREKESNSFIALPDDFRSPDKYEKVKILATSTDTRPEFSVGQEVVVLSHMVEEVDFGHGTIYLVLENHVVGILKESEL